MNKRLNFGGDPDHRLDTGIIFRIRHYWEIRKVVNGHKFAAHTASPDDDIGRTCLGGGMHCPSASSYLSICRKIVSTQLTLNNAAVRLAMMLLGFCRVFQPRALVN